MKPVFFLLVSLFLLIGCERRSSPYERLPKDLKWQDAPPLPPKKEWPSSRCDPTVSKSLRLFSGGELVWEKTNAEVTELAQVPREGLPRNLQQASLARLVDLLPADASGGMLEIEPCEGRIRRLEIAAVRAEPARYLLKSTGKGFLKLLDSTFFSGGGNPELARNLHALRIASAQPGTDAPGSPR